MENKELVKETVESTLDMQKAMNNVLEKLVAEGFLEQMIEKQIRATVKDVVEDTFKSYSNFGEELKAQIKEKLEINLDELKIQSYSKMINGVIESAIGEVMHKEAIGEIQESVNNMLSMKKGKYRLSEVIDKFREYGRREHDKEDGDEISFHYDPDTTVLAFIHFDVDADVRKYQCKYKLVVNTSKEGKRTVHSIGIDGENIGPKRMMDTFHDFDAFLFNLYVTGAEIVLDFDDVETEYQYEDYVEGDEF